MHDKGAYLTFGLALVCILLTVVAINAQAAEDRMKSEEPAIMTDMQALADPVRNLIESQLTAIRDRDADSAYALTTEEFHEKFGTAKEFLSHLRFEVRPLYNHENFTFLEQADLQDSMIQKVRMEDHYGDPVTVIYRVEKQESGEWLIDSLAILEAADEGDPI